MPVRIGTCAWADHHHFYPKSVKPSERLAFYSEYFSLVEVDSSYYGIPNSQTVRQWVRQTPRDFVFDVKAYRTLTQHDRGEAGPELLEQHFTAFTKALTVLADAEKLGVVLFQFPPWFVCTPQHQEYVERVVHKMSEFTVGVEFRHRSWFLGDQRASTVQWLHDLRAVNVVCDEPQAGMGTIPFVPDVTHSKYVMFRLHGRNEHTWYQKGLTSSQQRFDYLYAREELREFLPIVAEWSNRADDVHILMNNNQGDYAVTNALDWKFLLGQPVKPRPQLEESTQLTLFDLGET
jgi:uncharacterized protein YecE (DUF72 family)